MYFNNNYSTNLPSFFNRSTTPNSGVLIATVEAVDTLPYINDESIDSLTRKFNNDPHIIKCRIIGSDYDRLKATRQELPNCIPLLPRNNNIIPKKGQRVLILLNGYDESYYADRFYIGPLSDSELTIKNPLLFTGSESLFKTTFTALSEDIKKIPEAKGIYAEYDNNYDYAIKGRDNADIVFKPSEVLIRGGKFVKNNPKEFNNVNPAYIQIKHGFKFNISNENGSTITKEISVNNIVANKINLITYDNGINSKAKLFSLTKINNRENTTPYIDDEELNRILNEAHPVVFGDILLKYLKLLETAFLSHNHNDFGISTPILENELIKPFITQKESLKKEMLSQNIKVN
jgi:hypothetical protein